MFRRRFSLEPDNPGRDDPADVPAKVLVESTAIFSCKYPGDHHCLQITIRAARF